MTDAAIAEGGDAPTESSSADIESKTTTTEVSNDAAETKPQGEAPATETTETTVESKSESSGDETTESEKVVKKNSFQERISQKTRQANEAKQRADESDERARIAEQRLAEALGPEPTRFPQLEDFDYDQNAYQQAVVQFNSDQTQRTVHRAMTEQDRIQAQQLINQANQAATEVFQARSAAFAEGHADYVKAVTDPAFVQSEAVKQAVVLSENGPELAYHLANNPDKTDAINRMAPGLALMELGRLSATLATPPPVITTNTPAPGKPVTSNGNIDKDPEAMSPEEYQKWRGYLKRNN